MKRVVSLKTQDGGYAYLTVILLMALASLAIVGSHEVSKTSMHTIRATNDRSVQFAEAEAVVGTVFSWFRANSASLVEPFRKENFYDTFDREDPETGDNEGADFSLPTRIKLNGTDTSVILTNDPTIATSAFPATLNINTGVNFDTETEFSAIDTNELSVRVTLLDAVPEDPDKDYGPPPADEPDTGFSPIFRIDAMTEPDRGVHLYGLFRADVLHAFDFGIYGENNLEIRQPCDSYNSADGAYSPGSNRNANCPAASNSTSQIHKNETIYGTLHTNGEIVAEPPYGGDVCANFNGGCPDPGEQCQGEQCGVPLLPATKAWVEYCPTQKPPTTISSDTTLSVLDNSPADGNITPGEQCWESITVNVNRTLTLNSSNAPYFIKTLDLKNNAEFEILPTDPNGTVEIYVEKIVGDKFNGGQIINGAGKPTNFTLRYLGTDALVLNGNAEMNVALVAYNAAVTVSGNFTYQGSLLAKELYLSGSGDIHYDESLGGTGDPVDAQFRLRKLVQYYR